MKDPMDLLPSHHTKLGALLRLPLRILPRHAVLPVIAGPNAGMKWIIGSGPHSCWLGINEIGKRRLFDRTVAPGTVVFDVGANVGSYTMHASRLCGREGHVVAFEPSPEMYGYLVKHVEINGLANVTPLQAALGDVNGRARFEPTLDGVTSHLSQAGSIEVECHRLDTLVENGVVPAPDCIKVDVEGAEGAVLRGALGVLSERRPVLFLATHGTEATRECEEILDRVGYALSPIPDMSGEFIARPGRIMAG